MTISFFMYIKKSIFFFFFQFQINHLMNFLGTVAQKALKITDKSVDIAFASCFQNDVFVVVVPKKVK